MARFSSIISPASRFRLQGFATRLARPPWAALPFAAVSSKKTYAGRVRTAKPGARGFSRESLSHPAHARQRCVATRGCRKSRNGHRRKREMASGEREIAPRRMRSATAGCPRDRRDSPAPTAVWNAGCSNYGKPGSLSSWCRSILSSPRVGEKR